MQGNEVFDASIYEFYYGRDASFNLLPLVKDRWTPDNPTSDIPRAGTSAGGYRPNSSLNVVDGSYLRLKNVTLNYDFDTGIESLSNVNIIFDGDYKVNMDFSEGNFVGYLEIDPSFTTITSPYFLTDLT